MDVAVVEPAPVAGSRPSRARPRPWRWPGRLAVGFALLTPLLVGVGIAVSTLDDVLVAWWIGFAAIAASLLAVSFGLVAAVGGWSRGAGIAGIVLGVLANPLVLVWGLDLLEGL